MAYAGIVPEECVRIVAPNTERICGKAQLFELVHNLIGWAELFAIMVCGVAVLYGGFLVMTSAGDSGKVSNGRQAITKAVVGIAIVFGAYLIVNTIISIFLPNCVGEWTVIGEKFDCK